MQAKVPDNASTPKATAESSTKGTNQKSLASHMKRAVTSPQATAAPPSPWVAFDDASPTFSG